MMVLLLTRAGTGVKDYFGTRFRITEQ